jgi:hypothetical protein
VRTLLVMAAGDPSKVPFYIAGAALALWAVGLTAYGLTRPSFPADIRGQRLVISVSALLFVLAVAMAIVTDK